MWPQGHSARRLRGSRIRGDRPKVQLRRTRGVWGGGVASESEALQWRAEMDKTRDGQQGTVLCLFSPGKLGVGDLCASVYSHRGNSGSAVFAMPLESVEPAGPEGVQFGGAAPRPTYFTMADMQSHETPLIPSRRTILSPFTKEFRGGVSQVFRIGAESVAISHTVDTRAFARKLATPLHNRT